MAPAEGNNGGISAWVREQTGGALGAGLVLVLLPGVALFWGLGRFSEIPTVGLPVLAVFGIMILLGALALVSTLFARLGLSDRTQALGLPEGSIRAAVTMALIVLFAIIAIMLYQTSSKPIPYVVSGLQQTERDAMVNDRANAVVAVVPEPCVIPPGAASCTAADQRFSVHLRQSVSAEAADLAKQLLILIGTLMTSVTSFYFGSKATAAAERTAVQAAAATLIATTAGAGSDAQGTTANAAGAPEPTSDAELPPARGGVATQ